VRSKRLDIDFFGSAFKEDPFPVYEEVRSVGNVVWNELLSGWMVVGYDEAVSVLTDPGDHFAILSGDPELTFWFEAPNMMTVDGPQHRRLRGALSPLFTRGAIARWEQRVAEVVEELLAPLVSGHFDVLREAKSHLAFGYGSHLCLGAPLARLETKVAVEKLLQVAPEYQLRDIDFGPSLFIRGPERGTVEVGARASA
jgi:cytochrome P450